MQKRPIFNLKMSHIKGRYALRFGLQKILRERLPRSVIKTIIIKASFLGIRYCTIGLSLDFTNSLLYVS